MKLSIDTKSETWRYIAQHVESRIAELRTCNDAISLDHDQTLLLRGRIAELKSIISLPTKDQPLTDE